MPNIFFPFNPSHIQVEPPPWQKYLTNIEERIDRKTFFTSRYEESFIFKKVEKLDNSVEQSGNNPCLEINTGSLVPALSLPFATFQETTGRGLGEMREERGKDTAVGFEAM